MDLSTRQELRVTCGHKDVYEDRHDVICLDIDRRCAWALVEYVYDHRPTFWCHNIVYTHTRQESILTAQLHVSTLSNTVFNLLVTKYVPYCNVLMMYH